MPKLSRSDLTLFAMGVVGVLVVVGLYSSAFPLAFVDMEVTREEAVDNARELSDGSRSGPRRVSPGGAIQRRNGIADLPAAQSGRGRGPSLGRRHDADMSVERSLVSAAAN